MKQTNKQKKNIINKLFSYIVINIDGWMDGWFVDYMAECKTEWLND